MKEKQTEEEKTAGVHRRRARLSLNRERPTGKPRAACPRLGRASSEASTRTRHRGPPGLLIRSENTELDQNLAPAGVVVFCRPRAFKNMVGQPRCLSAWCLPFK